MAAVHSSPISPGPSVGPPGASPAGCPGPTISGHNDVTGGANANGNSHTTTAAAAAAPAAISPLPLTATPPAAAPNPMSGGAAATGTGVPETSLNAASSHATPGGTTMGAHFGSGLFAKPLKVDDFVRIRTLGTGTFARVCLVRRREPRTEDEARQVFALKVLRKAAVVKLKQIDHVRHERRILEDVSGYPFITHLRASFADPDFLYLLLDYVPGGELFSYLRKFRRFDEPTAQFYAAEIVLVLEYLHEQQDGVAYRDLKPENLLLDDRGHVKLVDFGFAKRLGRDGADGALETYTLCGTPEYIAPEVIQNMGHTTAVDWWALGILIYEFLTGYPPFWHQNPLEIYRQILEKPVVFPQDPVVAPAAQDLIRQLCTVDRSRRLGNLSGGAARVKAHPFFAGIDWDALYARRDQGPIVPPVRYVGDTQCFDVYPETDAEAEPYTAEMAHQYDKFFANF
ncbi:cyclic-AMP-dependent protein kinase catalytic [Niveomyces insectorum RCEF 264]|uniref:cAMP-dependent protein kinase n=1 Tax=Niveomyces insectorum RCEF 264 TaxID=1081102 RepID=A0A167UJC1_9HYPO|nr:cyclic-AMP-dependent protein kinase catalytic [Niveomyces insectorum RCEF 264]